MYQYTYGTPQFKDGRYKYWNDYGFHVRTPGPEDLREFISAWVNLIKNEPTRQLKAAFVMVDFGQIQQHGDYNEEEYSWRLPDFEFWLRTKPAWGGELVTHDLFRLMI